MDKNGSKWINMDQNGYMSILSFLLCAIRFYLGVVRCAPITLCLLNVNKPLLFLPSVWAEHSLKGGSFFSQSGLVVTLSFFSFFSFFLFFSFCSLFSLFLPIWFSGHSLALSDEWSQANQCWETFFARIHLFAATHPITALIVNRPQQFRFVPKELFIPPPKNWSQF